MANAGATSNDLSELLHSTDFLKCPGCSEIFAEPLLLPCLHSVCRPCVQNYLKTHDSHDDLECPQCHVKVKSNVTQGEGHGDTNGESNGHGMLTENHFLKSLAELHECQNAKSSKTCDYCRYDKKSVTATSRCLECHDNLCSNCADAHRRTKLTRHHKIASFDQIQLGRFDADIRDFQNIECETHAEEHIKFLCKKCDQLICRECKVSEHEKHSCMDLEESCDRFKTKNVPVLERVKEKCTGLENYVQFLDGYRKHVTENADHVIEQIAEHAQKLHKMVDEYKDTMTANIQKAVKEDHKMISGRSKEASALAEQLSSSTHYLDTLLQHGKQDEILYSRQILTNRLSRLVHVHADSVTTKLNQYFRPGAMTTKNMEAIFGKSDSFHQTLNEDNVRGICEESSIQINQALPMPTESAELVREFLAKGVSDIKDIWPTGLTIDKTGHMYIVDRENKRIKVFDRYGKFENEFGHTGSGHLSCPYDIVLLYNGNLAVTDYNDEEVKLFSTSGRYLRSWRQGFKYPRGIAVNSNNEVIVADVNSHRVTIHNPDTGDVLKTIGGKMADGCLIFTDPYYVTTNHKNFTLVTDWVSPNVKVFDPAGKMMDNYVTYGIGRDRVLQPYGICTDTYGYIFVADNQNHRVHLIGPDGKFIRFLLTQQQHGIWHPMALKVNHEGHLVVTEALGKVKVFKYM